MESFIDLAKKRQSTRQFRATKVSRDKLELCLEAARLAPSACNSQPWEFVVVDDPVLVKKATALTFSKLVSFNKFVATAPVLILVLADGKELSAQIGAMLRKVPYELLDIGMAVEHFCLQAAETDLGTCILGWLREKELKVLLSIPKRRRIVLGIAVGYPVNTDIREKKRKSMDHIRHYARRNT